MARLHEVGCERDRAANRQLHMDEYRMLVLLSLFNPVVRSLRAIQQASELRKVQRKLDWAKEDELLAHLAKLEHQDARQ